MYKLKRDLMLYKKSHFETESVLVILLSLLIYFSNLIVSSFNISLF